MKAPRYRANARGNRSNLLAASIAAALITVAGGLTLVIADAAPADAHSAPIKLESQKITLPFGDGEFPAGPIAKIANEHCLLCHSAGMVYTQPPLSQAVWVTEVTKMVKAYGCPLRDDEIVPLATFMHDQRGIPIRR
jgi:hypothetical protein